MEASVLCFLDPGYDISRPSAIEWLVFNEGIVDHQSAPYTWCTTPVDLFRGFSIRKIILEFILKNNFTLWPPPFIF
jgi:hypothetical protein